jgi:hypothetical protein
LGLLGVLFKPKEDAGQPEMPEILISKKFVSEAEANFFKVLRTVVADRGVVLMQVSLQQVLTIPGNRQTPGRQAWQNRIAAKSLDFLICDPNHLRPLVAIELDEPSHAKPSRQTRDEVLDQLLQAAKLPLLRVLTSRQYDTRELAQSIEPHL